MEQVTVSAQTAFAAVELGGLVWLGTRIGELRALRAAKRDLIAEKAVLLTQLQEQHEENRDLRRANTELEGKVDRLEGRVQELSKLVIAVSIDRHDRDHRRDEEAA